jgi:tRNA modification GTPase
MTIFALSSPPGRSGIAVVRISGLHGKQVLESITKKKAPPPQKSVLRTIYDLKTKAIIDRALVQWFKGPKSYTGEDVVELYLHGGHSVVKSLFKVLKQNKHLRLAEPGEFTKKAFLNGKMDLTEAEGIADLIDAETFIQQQQAIKQMGGSLGTIYKSWDKKLTHILAHIEAYIDFPDENIESSVVREIRESLNKLIKLISLHLNDKRKGEILREGIHIAILGKPNVGKSSFLNYLSQREVAIVSEMAGTTRDIIEVRLNLSGYPIRIVDTAGLRTAKSQVEREGIRRALQEGSQSNITILLLDASNKVLFTKKMDSLLRNKNNMVIVNKIDKVQKKNLTRVKKILHNRKDICYVSILNNQGLDKVLMQITRRVKKNIGNIKSPLITRERHRDALEQCLHSLTKIPSRLSQHNIELVAEDIRLALRALGLITGKTDTEELLGIIFKNFCIGK